MPHIAIRSNKCTGCHMCELACSAWHEGAYRPSVARLRVEVNPTTAAVKGHTCLQMACAKCEEACPEGAIERHPVVVEAMGLDAAEGYVLRSPKELWYYRLFKERFPDPCFERLVGRWDPAK